MQLSAETLDHALAGSVRDDVHGFPVLRLEPLGSLGRGLRTLRLPAFGLLVDSAIQESHVPVELVELLALFLSCVASLFRLGENRVRLVLHAAADPLEDMRHDSLRSSENGSHLGRCLGECAPDRDLVQ